MLTAPACEFLERWTQCVTIFTQGIHRAQNVLAVHLSLHNPGSLKISELRSENFLRDLRDAPLQFTVAFMTRLELSENQRLPFPSDYVDRHRNGALCSQHS